MELTPSQKKTVRHQFDSFCRKVLREEARDYERHIAWRSDHEVMLFGVRRQDFSSIRLPLAPFFCIGGVTAYWLAAAAAVI